MWIHVECEEPATPEWSNLFECTVNVACTKVDAARIPPALFVPFKLRKKFNINEQQTYKLFNYYYKIITDLEKDPERQQQIVGHAIPNHIYSFCVFENAQKKKGHCSIPKVLLTEHQLSCLLQSVILQITTRWPCSPLTNTTSRLEEHSWGHQDEKWGTFLILTILIKGINHLTHLWSYTSVGTHHFCFWLVRIH